MKVKELKEKLEAFDDDHDVFVDIGYEDTPCFNVVRVYEGSLWNIVIEVA